MQNEGHWTVIAVNNLGIILRGLAEKWLFRAKTNYDNDIAVQILQKQTL